MRRQACQGDLPVAVAKQGPCGMLTVVTYALVFLAPICNTVEPPVSNHPKNVKTRWLLTGGGRLREFRPLWVKT